MRKGFPSDFPVKKPIIQKGAHPFRRVHAASRFEREDGNYRLSASRSPCLLGRYSTHVLVSNRAILSEYLFIGQLSKDLGIPDSLMLPMRQAAQCRPPSLIHNGLRVTGHDVSTRACPFVPSATRSHRQVHPETLRRRVPNSPVGNFAPRIWL